jgi:hypothetical protein
VVAAAAVLTATVASAAAPRSMLRQPTATTPAAVASARWRHRRPAASRLCKISRAVLAASRPRLSVAPTRPPARSLASRPSLFSFSAAAAAAHFVGLARLVEFLFFREAWRQFAVTGG